MKIEFDGSEVLKDGEHVGTMNDVGLFVPIAKLHHITAKAVVKHLANLNKERMTATEIKEISEARSQKAELSDTDRMLEKAKVKAPFSEQPERTELGDIDPELIEWRRKNWSASDFETLYPAIRLRQIGL